MTAPTLDVATLEQVTQGPAEQCSTWVRSSGDRPVALGQDTDDEGLERCERLANYVIRSRCPGGSVYADHDIRTPVCLEHVDGVVEALERAGRCGMHPRRRVRLVRVDPVG